MPSGASRNSEMRVLLLAPTARDGEITRSLLNHQGIECVVCRTIDELTHEVPRGVGAVLMTQDAISEQASAKLPAIFANQPNWSDIPVVLLIRGGAASATATRVLDALTNVTLLERPAPMLSVVSAVQAAVRGRVRQYQMRDQFEAVRQAEAETRRSREQFEAMANSIPQLAWMANPDGWIFWYNQRWHDYCGTTPRQMEGWGWMSVHDPAELPRVMSKWKAAIAGGSSWEDTFPLRRHDGEFRWHLSRARAVRDASGKVVLWFGTNTDITEERKKAEEREALLRSEQAARADAEHAGRMKDEFLATLSHELRTPLNAILGWSNILQTHLDDEQVLAEGLAAIERNTRAQTQLIDDLLDMSRIISGKVRLEMQLVPAVSFVDAAIETVLPAADAKGIRIEKVFDTEAGRVYGDPGRLQQVVWNLLSNAIKFTPRSGRIRVLLQRVSSHFEISVADTGSGISPEFLPHVFERFRQADASTTRKFGGLGLGLSICKHLAELHGGTIQAMSPGPRQGSTFTLLLPVPVLNQIQADQSDSRSSRSRSIAAADATLDGLKVLLVDDEPDARTLVKRLLEDRGAKVMMAGSAPEALELVESERPDVLVSDIGMPDVDGYEFLRRVRALGEDRGGKVPAVALTAFARSEDRTRALLGGFAVHVSKPVEPKELIATVASVAGRVGGEALQA